MKNKLFNTAPIPFQGQKRYWIKKFLNVLGQYDDSYTFVDLFGGSGLLANTAKCCFPAAKVVYNDFDNFSERLANISRTNKLLKQLRELISGCERKHKIDEPHRSKILKLLAEQEYVDYITISSSLLFPMNYVLDFEEMQKATLYNRVKQADYADAAGYLFDVETVSQDYKAVFEQYNDKKTVFIVYPPYLSTDTKTYLSDASWTLRDYLDVLQVIKNTNYVYFTSDKSDIVELCAWMEANSSLKNPFAGAEMECIKARSPSFNYTDIMLSKRAG